LTGKDYPPVPVKASSLLASTEGKVFLRVAEGAIENQEATQAAEKAFAEAEQLLNKGQLTHGDKQLSSTKRHSRTGALLETEAVKLPHSITLAESTPHWEKSKKR
jgi:Tfp pilus assembly protein PilX